jgi:hypothetical protein
MKYTIRAYNDGEECIHTAWADEIGMARSAAKILRKSLNAYFVQVTKGQDVVAHYDRLKKG